MSKFVECSGVSGPECSCLGVNCLQFCMSFEEGFVLDRRGLGRLRRGDLTRCTQSFEFGLRRGYSGFEGGYP